MRSAHPLPTATLTCLALVFVLPGSDVPAGAQTNDRPPFPIAYVLGPDSHYEEGCFAPCECPILLQDGVKGGFALDFVGFEPPFIVYDVNEINWLVPTLNKTFTGSGRYMIGWRGTALQQLKVSLSENGAAPVTFDSGLVPLSVSFPFIDIAISMNGFYCHDKAFYLKAAPARIVRMGAQVDPTSLSWDRFADSPGYDAVFGSLSVLRQTGGDFTSATAGCLASDVATSPVDASPDPPQGEAFWYLVRAYGGVAGTSYEAGDAGQGGTCDAQIDAAPNSCP
jgi:hypothetical protein